MDYDNPKKSGFEAFFAGRTRNDNPVNGRTNAHARTSWNQGWSEAEELGITVVKDGNAWCAHGGDFINLQESIAGFGDTPADAVNEYMQEKRNHI